jgi:hypothetical protein
LNAFKALKTTAMAPRTPKIADKVKKSIILAKYDAACRTKGISNHTSPSQKVRPYPYYYVSSTPLPHH